MIKKILIAVILIIIVLSGSMFFLIRSYLRENIFNPEITFITLKYGTSSDKIIEQFNQIGFFKPNWFFKYYLRFEYKNRKKFIDAGTYQIPLEITNSELIDKLFTQDLLYRNKLTIPEGSNIFEVARAFKKYLKIDSIEVIKLLQNREFCEKLKLNSMNLEGYIKPETYFFEDNQPLEFIIKILVKNQKDIIRSIFSANNSKFSEYEILTLASIIQAETSSIDEMPIVSSVYHNRLRTGMPLQADPTVLYPYFPEKTITKSMLRKPTSYNTYLKSGLPPTPINSPSREAIYAAANPANTNYLFFVAKDDSSKLHNFSTNYTVHKKNVEKYRNKINIQK